MVQGGLAGLYIRKGDEQMEVMQKIGLIGLIPVVVVENTEEALKAAAALIEGGIPVLEITMRTAAGVDAIRAVKERYPDTLIGAGTVLTLEKCKESVEAGAEFIVSPGFNHEIVDWCVEHQIAVIPGCVTPTEIEMALARGIKTVKFFPTNIYGGIKACAALQGPYKSAEIKFIPTGGVDLNNLDDFSDKTFIHAVGGGWLCSSKAIAAGDFNGIRETAAASVHKLLGFELAHVGIHAGDEKESEETASKLCDAFGMDMKKGNSSNFVGSGIEVVKSQYLGTKGHIAVRVNNMDRALYYLSQKGYEADEMTAKYKNGKLNAIYLKERFGGFAVHLLQK